MNIELTRWPSASLSYHVLSHLDLGRDAANLHRGRKSPKPWVEALERSHLAEGPARLELQFAGLAFTSTDELLKWTGLGGPLRRCFGDALCAERLEHLRHFQASENEAKARFEAARRVVLPPLSILRAALWHPRPPPPLTVVHVPELGPAGRGYPRPEGHRVAVSLEMPFEHVLCQIFHEEVHPVSDRELPSLGARDTRAGTAGSTLHLRIERHAVARGAEVVGAALPELRDVYERWRHDSTHL